MRYLSRKIITMRGLAVLTSIMVCMTSLLFSSKLEAVAQDNPLDKLDKIVSGIVEQNDREEVISTAVWFTDIDYDEVYDEERSILSSYIESGEMPYEIMELLEENEKVLSDNLPLECVQQAIHIERAIAEEKYLIQNPQFFYDVLPDYDGNIYISHYAPCVLAELSVEEILLLADSDGVQSIMYSDESESESVINDTMEITEYDDVPRSSDSYIINQFKNDIGITAAQQYVNTSGIVIGILEPNFIPDMSKAVLNPINASGRFHIIPSSGMVTDGHPTLITTLLAGKTNDGFEGVAYDATYYYTCLQHYSSYFTNPDSMNMAAVEDLIGHDVNIITFSGAIGGTPQSIYGVFSQFFDHVSTCHHVHFCNAVGNVSNGITQAENSSMGYNTITVGSMERTTGGNYTYSFASPTSYSENPYLPHKPDVCAPHQINVPYNPTEYYVGSSVATPLVAGALAYFLKASSAVVWAPAMGKAAVCSGSKFGTSDVYPNVSDNSQISMCKKVGVGLINIYPAFESVYNWNTSNFSFGLCLAGHSLNFNKNITVTNSDITSHKRMNVCFCYNVRNTYAAGVSHINNNATIGTCYPIYMTVTAPNGDVYTSNYAYTNMEVISFVPSVAGTYNVHVEFANTGTVFNDNTRFGFSANLVA